MAGTAPGERLTQVRVANSEWIKLRSLRSTAWLLAVSSVMTVGIGVLVSSVGLDPWLATLAAIGAGAVIGTVNGILVTRFGIPSFIVTLAMLTAYRSAALILSGQKPSVTQGDRNQPPQRFCASLRSLSIWWRRPWIDSDRSSSERTRRRACSSSRGSRGATCSGSRRS